MHLNHNSKNKYQIIQINISKKIRRLMIHSNQFKIKHFSKQMTKNNKNKRRTY